MNKIYKLLNADANIVEIFTAQKFLYLSLSKIEKQSLHEDYLYRNELCRSQ